MSALAATAGTVTVGHDAVPARVAPQLQPADWSSRIDPELLASALRQPYVALTDPLRARRNFARASRLSRALNEADLPLAELAWHDTSFSPPDCDHQVPVRIYRPHSLVGDTAALVYFHGGAFLAGDLDTDHARCVQLAVGVGCQVISVGYRQPPEYPFPAPVQDCSAAVRWVARAANELGVDADRIAIGGSSAGATLAAGVALKLRDDGGPRPILQALLFPALDDRLDSPSMREFPATSGWQLSDSALMWRHYLGELAGEPPSPYAVPARATDLAGVAPAFVLVAEVDALRDETLDYAQRLMDADVPVELLLVPRTFHGFDVAMPGSTAGVRAFAEQCAALSAAFTAVPTSR